MMNYLMKKMNRHLLEVEMMNYSQAEVLQQAEVQLLVAVQLRVEVEAVPCLLAVVQLLRMLRLHLQQMMQPH
jgi:hypothetical protein